MSRTYQELMASQEEAHRRFGQMLLNWRRRNGWTQYTAFEWAKEAGFEAISYGNLSVIEQGKAGDLRLKAFFQLAEVNRRLAERDFGAIRSQQLREKIENGAPICEESTGIAWDAPAFWSCYVGLIEVPESLRNAVAPTVSQRRATELCNRWKARLHEGVTSHGLDPLQAMQELAEQAPADKRERFIKVLTGFGDYTPEDLETLWSLDNKYEPEQWLQAWEENLSNQGDEREGSQHRKNPE